MKNLLLLILTAVAGMLFVTNRNSADELSRTKAALANAEQRLQEEGLTDPAVPGMPRSASRSRKAAEKTWLDQKVEAATTTLDPKKKSVR